MLGNCTLRRMATKALNVAMWLFENVSTHNLQQWNEMRAHILCLLMPGPASALRISRSLLLALSLSLSLSLSVFQQRDNRCNMTGRRRLALGPQCALFNSLILHKQRLSFGITFKGRDLVSKCPK